MRIASKLALGVAITISVVAVVNAAMRIEREEQMFEEDLEHDHESTLVMVVTLLEHVASIEGEAAARELIRQIGASTNPPSRWVWLDAPATHADASTASLPIGWELTRRWFHETDDRLCSYERLDLGAQRGAVELCELLTAKQDYLAHTLQRSLIVMAGIVALSIASIFALAHLFVGRSIKRLVAHARAIGSGDLTTRLALKQRDEIGDLAHELDAMAERLAEARRKTDVEVAARLTAVTQLRHADRLATVGQLGAGIAHELGTPLNVIIGHAQLALEDHALKLPIQPHIETIVQQARRSAEIIRQLLDFARRREPRRTQIDARTLVDQTLELLRPMARRHQVALVSAEGPAVEVDLDRPQIQQALTNLIVNAIQATHGGRVTVTVERVPCTRRGESGCVQFVVEDTGTGISADQLGVVFEPFFTTKDPGDGTGLGLAVAYGIVRDHDGWITVTSEVGRGSRFVVELPEAAS